MFLFPVEILLIEDDNDRCFMEQLYIDQEKAMYYWANRILGNKEDSSDAVHSACIALINNISTLRNLNSATLHSYVVSTTRNTAIDLYRKRARQNEFMFPVGDDVMNSFPDSGAIEDNMLFEENSVKLKEAIARLPINESNLLRWKYFDGLSDQEIAEYLNIKTRSVRAYLTKARRHLHELMTEEA